MNQHYYVADQNGRITETFFASDERRDGLIAAGRNLVAGEADPDMHYIVDGQITARPECCAVLDGSVLRNLPVPCVIIINGREYECTATIAELEFDQPGVYEIRVVPPWPYLDREFSYENPAQ